MYGKIEKKFIDLISAGKYVMTVHAFEEMDDDGLDIFDIENIKSSF